MVLKFPKDKLLITVTGPSGSGKDTLMQHVIEDYEHLKFFITTTTRSPRDYEKNGEHYHFIDKETFLERLEAGDFLEYSEHYGNYYGTLKETLFDYMDHGLDSMSDLNWTGVAQIQKKVPANLVKILVLPPSAEVLKERFTRRAKKSKEDAALLEERFNQAIRDMDRLEKPGYVFTNPDMIGSTREDYDYIIVNDDLAAAVQMFKDIILKERQKHAQTS